MKNHISLRPIRITACFALLLSVLTMSGCDVTGGLGSSIEASTKEAMHVLDSAIRDIQTNSATWQTVLQHVADQLPKDISETVRVDAQILANRSIATAGTEFRCDIDFLGKHAIQSLQRLKAELLNENPAPVPPEFCQVVLPSVDLNVSPLKWSTVMLYGYDLDHQDTSQSLLKVFLVNKQGTTPLPEERIGRTTHYQITLNLGGMASQLYHNQVRKIVVSWDGTSAGYPQIVITPWEKQRRVEPPLAVSSTGPFFPPPIGNGDRDFNTREDRPTDLTVRGEIRHDGSTVYNRMYMHAREVASDNTEVDGWTSWTAAYSAPTGWKIVEVRPGAPSIFSMGVTSNQTDSTPIVASRPTGEVVDRFEIWVDRDGDDAGSYSRMITHWRPLEITIEQVEPEWLR